MKTYHKLILVVLFSFLPDRFSKQLILLFPRQEIYFFDYSVIKFHQNYGIALGMPFNINSLCWPAILILGLLIIYFKRKIIFSSLSRKGIIGLGLIIGGAAGNVFDRLAFGYIIDFINIPHLNLAINFADLEIIVGSILLAITTLRIKGNA